MVLHSATHLFHEGELDKALRDLVDIDGLLRHFGGHGPGSGTSWLQRAREVGLDASAILRVALFDADARHAGSRAGDHGVGGVGATAAGVMADGRALPARAPPESPDLRRLADARGAVGCSFAATGCECRCSLLAYHLARKALARRKKINESPEQGLARRAVAARSTTRRVVRRMRRPRGCGNRAPYNLPRQ